ncbi:MAG: hypothetical protein EBU90_24955, partial [Proteobacteria bacterium]|nr:hypothetical protein [Pseudomonadota bacterium]
FIFENANHNEISLYEAIRRIKIPTGSGTGTVTSVGLTMPSAFTVTGSPITTSGVFTVTGAGTSSQYIDGTGALQTFPSIGGPITANNGLTANTSTNVQLGSPTNTGSPLLEDRYINTTSAYQLIIFGNVPTANKNSTLYVINNDSSSILNRTIYATATTGRAIFGQSSSGVGVYGLSSSQVGVFGQSSTGIAAYFQTGGNAHAIYGQNTSETTEALRIHQVPTSNNTILDTFGIFRGSSSGVATNGMGQNWTMYLATIVSGSSNIESTQFSTYWTDATNYVSKFEILTRGSNISFTPKLSVNGSGALEFNKYGLGTFSGTLAYSLGVDASGNVIEFVGGGGTVTSVTATTPLTSSGGTTPDISTSMNTNKLIGRGTAGVGVMEEITLGTGLSLSGTTLNATGGGIKSGIASGTNNYTVTISGVSSYTDGDAYVIKFTNGNDADSDININGLGVKNLVKEVNTRVTGGDIVSGQDLIIIYDGTNFQTLGVAPNQLFAYVTNDDSVAINKGQPVYAYGSAGNRMSVKLASNLQDSTSAQTIGVVFSTSIAPNQKGFIITQGVISNVNTSAYTAGAQLYLGATAGTLTATKPYAPNHLVYIGIVERANAGNGQIYIKPQNGYELDELHDVDLITSAPVNNDLLTYVSGVPNLWKNRSLGAILGGSTSQYVRGDGSLATTPTGTVTGVTATSPITSSGGTAPVISTSMATNRLIGRSTAGTGVMEEIQVGNFLTLSSGVLSSVPPIELSQVYTTAWNLAPTIILAAASGGTSTSANQWYIIPKYLPPNTSISDIGVRISTLSSSLTGRLAIYTSTYDSTNKGYIPDSRVANSGALTISGAGFVSFTLPSTIQVSGWVFFVVGFTSTTCTFRNVNNNSVIGLPALVNSGSPLNTDTTVRNGMYINTSNARTSDPPNPWTGALSQVNSNIPAIFFFIP